MEPELDAQIAAIIKSNLISEGLSSEQIIKISEEMTKDILDILDNYNYIKRSKNVD